MVLTIGGVDDLEAPEVDRPGIREYVRHMIDQTVLISSRTGECFKRRDGARWPHAGYKITRRKEGPVDREPATAPEDHTDDKQRNAA